MVVVKQYPGSRPEFYLTVNLALDNIKNRIGDFTDFREIYDIDMINSLQTKANAAEALPDEDSRAQPHESLRLQVVSTAGTCLKRWRYLKRYIAAAFPDDEENQWGSAGWAHYTDAAGDHWASVKSLMTTAIGYINSNVTALTANRNMPAAFPQQMTDAYDAFLSKLNEFYQAEETAQVGTQTKLEAENTVFRNVMGCLLDGATIFEENEAVRKQYEWQQLSTMISPPRSTVTPPPPQAEATTTYTIEGQQVQGGSPAPGETTVPASTAASPSNAPPIAETDPVPAGTPQH